MLNTQQPEKLIDHIEVHHVWLTIQGEGPLIGTPSVFVRLAGCNLQCPLCDTEYTKKRKVMSCQEIYHEIVKTRPSACLVVLTGGEPYRHNIGPLCRYLIDRGMVVQIETNGSVWRDGIPDDVVVVCSPKTFVHPNFTKRADAWKFVVQESIPVDENTGLPTHALGNTAPIQGKWPTEPENIFIQPADEGDDEQNKRNIQLALRLCFEHDYNLCLQVHKIIGLE